MTLKYIAEYIYKARVMILTLLFFLPTCATLTVLEIEDMFQEKACIEGMLVPMPGGPALVSTASVQQQTFIKSLPSMTESIQDFTTLLPKLYSGLNFFSNTSPNFSSRSDQSPMNLVNELARYNNIEYKYYLTSEDGPPHQKRFTIVLNLGSEEYIADGTSLKKAQHAAAAKALAYANFSQRPVKIKHGRGKNSGSLTPGLQLQGLASQIGQQMFNEGDAIENKYSARANSKQAVQFDKFDESNDHCELGNEYARMIDQNFGKSPISIVHEIGAKKKMNVAFELISEEGPDHAKVFGTRCSFAQLVANGVGSTKKKSKTEAAEKMLLLLRMLPDTCLEDSPTRKKRKRKNRKKRKNKNKNLIKVLDINSGFPNNGLNLGSSLNQIQQAFKKMNPMLSSLGDISIANVGSGSLKKLAKRAASEVLGKESIKPSTGTKQKSNTNELPKLKALKDKMDIPLENDNIDNPLKPDILGGMGDPSNGYQFNQPFKQNMDWYQTIAKNFLNNDIERAAGSLLRNLNTNNLHQTQMPESSTRTTFKEELLYMTDLLDIKVQFSDFPTANQQKYLSLVSVSTKPGRVCFGVGPSIEISQEKAAAEALFDLSDQGLHNMISRND